VIALLAQREHREVRGSDTRCSEQATVAALQLGERQLELAQRRVGDPRVLKPLALTARLPLALGDAVEGELDRLVDRRNQRPISGGTSTAGG